MGSEFVTNPPPKWNDFGKVCVSFDRTLGDDCMLNHDAAPTPYDEQDPDWSLMRAMADGDVRALNEIYARYGPMLLGF